MTLPIPASGRRLKSLADVPVDGKTVLVRVDFNVSVGKDSIVDRTEDYRIEAALPTIHYLQQRRCRIVLLTHFGRPKPTAGTARALAWDLEPVHHRVQELLNEDVAAVHRFNLSEVKAVVTAQAPGGVVLLPNVRLDEREVAGNTAFAQELAELADVYVNEAFSVSHRRHTSVALLPKFLPACAGLRTVQEIGVLGALRQSPEKPYVAIVSGAKIATKVGVLRDLLDRVDYLCLGGRIANVFLCAQGHHTARYCDAQEVGIAQEVLELAGDKLLIPRDVVIGPAEGGIKGARVVDVQDLPNSGEGIWDIGPATVQHMLSVCRGAKTVLWNGPVGMCEVAAYAKGTDTLAQGLADMRGVYRVVGGGDTVGALERLRLMSRFDHVSVGGGAMLTYLEGQPMPGLEPLYA